MSKTYAQVNVSEEREKVKIIKSFAELVEVVDRLAREKNIPSLRVHLDTYINNIHNEIVRLENLVAIQRILAEYNYFVSEDLAEKLVQGKIK